MDVRVARAQDAQERPAFEPTYDSTYLSHLRHANVGRLKRSGADVRTHPNQSNPNPNPAGSACTNKILRLAVAAP